MAVNADRARGAIRSAERELGSASKSLEDEDWVGALKYLQESMEYAAKAVLIAYGVDYPKVHSVGRFLLEMKGKYPSWFAEQVGSISELVDSLARERPMLRYPYEFVLGEYDALAGELLPKGMKALAKCSRLVEDVVGSPRPTE